MTLRNLEYHLSDPSRSVSTALWFSALLEMLNFLTSKFLKHNRCIEAERYLQLYPAEPMKLLQQLSDTKSVCSLVACHTSRDRLVDALTNCLRTPFGNLHVRKYARPSSETMNTWHPFAWPAFTQLKSFTNPILDIVRWIEDSPHTGLMRNS